jgi:plasmid stabilization system protein ParE
MSVISLGSCLLLYGKRSINVLICSHGSNLEAAIASLATFPGRCSLAPEATAVGRESRQLVVGKNTKYRVLFVVQDQAVSVLHVRHSRQSRSIEKDEE